MQYERLQDHVFLPTSFRGPERQVLLEKNIGTILYENFDFSGASSILFSPKVVSYMK